MLILTRKVGEVIEVGDSVKITVVCLQKNRVRIGIEAPADLRVHRQEVADAIRREKDGQGK